MFKSGGGEVQFVLCVFSALCFFAMPAQAQGNRLNITGTTPAPGTHTNSSISKAPTSSTVTITCHFPTSESDPLQSQSGLSLERIQYSARGEQTFATLAAADGSVEGGAARDVSVLSHVSVNGSLHLGWMAFTLQRPVCEDAGEYFCASNAGTARDVLDLLPGPVIMTTVLENSVIGSRLMLECSVNTTLEMSWKWEYKNLGDETWSNVTTDITSNITNDTPDMWNRCKVSWTSVLSQLLTAIDAKRTFRCYGVCEKCGERSRTEWAVYTVPDVLPTVASHVSSPLDELTSRGTAAAVQLQRSPVKGVSAGSRGERERSGGPDSLILWTWATVVGMSLMAVVVLIVAAVEASGIHATWPRRGRVQTIHVQELAGSKGDSEPASSAVDAAAESV